MNLKLINKIIKGRSTVEKALNQMGLQMTSDIKRYIHDRKVVPHSARAIEESGATLWDTGQLVQSLAYSISHGGPAKVGKQSI